MPDIDDSYSRQASTDGAVGNVILQARDKLNLRGGFTQQLESMFNPEVRTGEFGLYAVENPGDVYRTILAQTDAAPSGANDKSTVSDESPFR
jgi:hypothetical protein